MDPTLPPGTRASGPKSIPPGTHGGPGIVPPVLNRPSSIATEVMPPGPPTIPPGFVSASPLPRRATSPPPVEVATPAATVNVRTRSQPSVAPGPAGNNGGGGPSGAVGVAARAQAHASRSAPASRGVPGGAAVTSGSVIAPPVRRAPWLLLALNLTMIVGGALFLRAALAKGGGDDRAPRGAAPGVGSPTPPPVPTPTPASTPTPTPLPRQGLLGAAMPAGDVATSVGAGSGGGAANGNGDGDGNADRVGGGTSGGKGGGGTSGGKGGGGKGSGATRGGGGKGSGATSGGGGGTTIDPYEREDEPESTAASLADEVNRHSRKSKAKFDRCHTQATKGLPAEQPLRGDVEVAFQILGTGETRNATIVYDTTGSTELGRCVLAVIASWQFTATGGAPTDFARPLHFGGR